MRRMRTSLSPKIQPGEILPGLRRQGSQAAENRKRTEKEVLCGQLGGGKAFIYKASKGQDRGKWYKVSSTPENAVLTVHKTRYDKHHLYPSVGEIGQLHPAPEFPL